MAARLCLRFLWIWLATSIAAASAMTMFSAVMRADLTFGLAVVVVLPLLFSAWVAGNSWVSQSQRPAPLATVLRYCAGLALLALLLGVSAALALGKTGWLGLSLEHLGMLAARPGLTATVAVLAFATASLITACGFLLGARAAARLLPQPKA